MLHEEEGETAARLAIPADVSAKIQALVDAGKLNVQFFPTRNTIAHKAILDDKFPTLQYLLTFPKLKINHQNKDGDSPLHLAVRNRDLPDDLIKDMVERGAKLNLKNAVGLTPFMELFLSHRSEDVIIHCWQRGGSVLVVNRQRENVLFLLLSQLVPGLDAEVEQVIFELFSLLLEPIEVYNSLTLILCRGDRGMGFMRQLKKKCCLDLNHQASNGDTILHRLVQKNNLVFLNSVLRFPGLDLSLGNSANQVATDLLQPRDPIRELLFNYHRQQLDESGAGDVSEQTTLVATGGVHQIGSSRRSTFVRVEDVLDDRVNINYEYELETKKTFVFAKGKVYEELIKTEAAYCRDMMFLFHYYFSELVAWKRAIETLQQKFYWRPGEEIREAREISDTGVFQMINSIELIIKVNGELLTQLKSILQNTPIFNMEPEIEHDIVELFSGQGAFGRLMEYYQFYSSIQRSKFELEQENRYLRVFLTEKDSRYGLLDSYLIKPIQRLPRYVLMLKELQKTYARFQVENDNLGLLREAQEYVASVCAKINVRRLQARQAKYTLQLSQYFRENHGLEILESRKLSYVFHDMDLTVLDSWPFRVRKLKIFMFSSVMFMVYQEVVGLGTVKKRETLLTFSNEDTTKAMMKITDDNFFSIKLMDRTNQVICYFLVKCKSCFSLIYTIQENFILVKDPRKFRLFHLEPRQQDELFKFHRIVLS